MTFVTRLTLQSGDRAALDGIVDDIKHTAERKGAALKGPHSHPPEKLSVPQHRRLHADDERMFPSWEYTVFTRELEIHGHDEFARRVAARDFPDSLHVEVEVEQIHGMGRGRN
ncbi:uS10/mL48 family ribosomal protein [Salinilacihabitans rarus]|uniref:uS10/mL48 family ribosomal protein n=1 Tax=Salinilacihabitans rarus TaxID=2961596 RepID=UPI0020C8B033|nr:uS10/mL48 family ribosomal protein [Salinilacihabitans rarus]